MSRLRPLPTILSGVALIFDLVFASPGWVLIAQALTLGMVFALYLRSRRLDRRANAEFEEMRRRSMKSAGLEDAHRDLLLSLLSPENRERFILRHSITVDGSQGGRYEIRLGVAMNVFGNNGVTYCALPRGFDYSPGAVIIAQMLMITTDEKQFLGIAASRARRSDLYGWRD